MLAIALHAAFARQPHGIASGPRFRLARGIGDEVHLSLEFLEAAEGFGIDDLHEHGGPPARRRIGAPMTCESRGEGLDQQRQREALVPGVDAAQG